MVARLDLPGLQIAFWRLLLGAVLYGLVLYAGGRRISLHTVRLVAPAGVVLGLQIGVFFVALHSTTVANATTIGALQPIVLLVVASRRFREPVGRWLVGGAVVAIGGVTLVMFGAGAGMGLNLRGDLLALVSMFLFSAYFALVKDVRHRVDTFTLQTTSMAVGALVLLPVAAVDAGTIGLPFPSGTQGVAGRPSGRTGHRAPPQELVAPARSALPHGPDDPGHTRDLGCGRLGGSGPGRHRHPGCRHGDRDRGAGPCGQTRRTLGRRDRRFLRFRVYSAHEQRLAERNRPRGT